jgi:hypothetical protein
MDTAGGRLGFFYALAVDQINVLAQPRTRRTRFSKSCRQRRTRRLAATFWEHTIRDESDLVRHIDYIHINPVKHGLVTRVRDWPYSSFHRMVKLGVLPEDWAGDVSDQAESFGERP